MRGQFVDYKRLLQVLCSEVGVDATHTVLKAPHHLFHLQTIAETFPGASFVWLHRSYVDVVHSCCLMNLHVHEYTSVAFEPPEVCDPPGAGFREAVSSKRFFLLWLMGLMVFTPGLTLSGLYKRFGMTSGAVIADDRFQSAMGGLAAVANGLGRVFFGALVDKVGYVKGYGVTAAATAALMLAFPFTVNSKLAYASALIGLIFALGGSMVMFITANAQIFGVRKAGEIYSLLFSAISLASLVGAKLTMRLLAPLGWSGVFKVLSAMGCAAAGLIYLLSLEKKNPAPWEQ